MKTARHKFGGVVELTATTGLLASLLLLPTGCETPEQTAMLGGLLAGNAALAGNSQQSAAYAAAAQSAEQVAQIQSQYRAAEAGRSEITVYSNSSGDRGRSRFGTDEEMDDGSFYTGNLILLRDGKWHMDGAGKLTSGGNEKSVIARNGKILSIKGKDVWPDGTEYEGEWNLEEHNGKGIISWKDGREYKGQWKVLDGKPDLPNGEGEMTWSDGRKYVGDYRDGRMHGFGKMTYPAGKVEEGVWRNDKFFGSEKRPDGQTDVSKFGSVSVAADDPTYEVFADGVFVGNTPAKLKLPEGAHFIEVKKSGFKAYRKEINVPDGSQLNLMAVLEKE